MCPPPCRKVSVRIFVDAFDFAELSMIRLLSYWVLRKKRGKILNNKRFTEIEYVSRAMSKYISRIFLYVNILGDFLENFSLSISFDDMRRSTFIGDICKHSTPMKCRGTCCHGGSMCPTEGFHFYIMFEVSSACPITPPYTEMIDIISALSGCTFSCPTCCLCSFLRIVAPD